MARGISPETNLGANLGSATQVWNKLFVNEIEANSITMPSSGNATYMNDLINAFADPAEAHNSIYRGAEITDDWATIQSNIQNGDFSNYYIGDWKPITLTTSETVVMEIAGINCYKNWGSTAIGNHIDFISRDCLATAYQFNTTATNNGTSDESSPWKASLLYDTLNNTSTGIRTQLPSELQSCIATKFIYRENRYSSGGGLSADTAAAWGVAGVLWIPAETEVFSHPSWSEIGYGTAGCQQYPIFRLNPSKIVKGAGNGGERCYWWTLSASRSNSTAFCDVTHSGYAHQNFANDDAVRVPLCFRVA